MSKLEMVGLRQEASSQDQLAAEAKPAPGMSEARTLCVILTVLMLTLLGTLVVHITVTAVHLALD